MQTRLKISILLGLAFFLAAFFTLTDYGINWDTINHLPRGQVYLRYMLTGKKDFSELPRYKMTWQDPAKMLPSKEIWESAYPARSFYQNDAFNFDWYMQIDGTGHPPLSDILSSVFNRVLFGHLKIVNDIDSYRVYGVFLSAVLVGVVYWWISGKYGSFSGLIAALSLAMYPLFWSESHFNTEKDIPEAVYLFFLIYSVYRGFTQKKWKWILLSGIFFGLALGTKFNVLFAPFVIIPWLLFYLKGKVFQKENLKLLLTGVFAVSIGMIIFYGSWPFLWQDIIGGTMKVFGFYKGIGTAASTGINAYPLIWIIATTPLIILALFFAGAWKIIADFKRDKEFLGLILILGFAVPVIRVMWPGSNIYGGIRQIMEFMPFMAAVAGVGAGYIVSKVKYKKPVYLAVLIGFLGLLIALIKIHPNENTFFNALIGGLRGAKEREIESWGNSFGAAYRQGIKWINANAEKNAKLAYAFELMPNIPLIWVRPDISFSNTQRSGFLRYGEYAITLTYQGTSTRSYYDAYLENTMEPVYRSSVDGVSVVKVWKNDGEHAKSGYKEIVKIGGVGTKTEDGKKIISLSDSYHLSHIKAKFSTQNCNALINGKVYLSSDGFAWRKLKDEFPMDEIPPIGPQPGKGVFYYPFAGDTAKFIKLDFSPADSCESNIQLLELYGFAE